MKCRRSTLVGIISSTIDFDSERGGHNVESLLAVLKAMGIIHPHSYTDIQVRLIIHELMERGQLDMCPNGALFIPEPPDPLLERFQGAWYLTTVEGPIKGPFASKTEAIKCQ